MLFLYTATVRADRGRSTSGFVESASALGAYNFAWDRLRLREGVWADREQDVDIHVQAARPEVGDLVSVTVGWDGAIDCHGRTVRGTVTATRYPPVGGSVTIACDDGVTREAQVGELGRPWGAEWGGPAARIGRDAYGRAVLLVEARRDAGEVSP